MICVVKHTSNKTIFQVLTPIISIESPGEKLRNQNEHQNDMHFNTSLCMMF